MSSIRHWVLGAMIIPGAAVATAAEPFPLIGAPAARAPRAATPSHDQYSDSEKMRPGIVAGVTAVEDVAQMDQISTTISEHFNTPLQRVSARLRRLGNLEGAGVYVEIRQAKLPLRVVLEPYPGDQVSLAANWVLKTPVKPQGAGTSGVAVFWVDRETQSEYHLKAPAHASRLTLVVNGREIASAQQIRHGQGRVTFLATR